jgi:4-hydroxy-3-polyprenylbenzoate decarboxylase
LVGSALRSFLDELRRRGDLLEIQAPVDPHLEMGEIAQRIVRRRGPALLFRRPVGSDVPVLMNLLATPERIALALGRPPSHVAAELDAFLHDAIPPRWSTLWNHRALLRRALSARISATSRAPWQATSGPGRLSRLPILTCWPEDGGRFITWPLVLTRHPTRGDDNLGLYRMQAFSDAETGMHWQLGKGGAFHHEAAERLSLELPCVVSLGADPLLMFAAMMPLPEGISEMAFAGFLRGGPTRVVRLGNGLFAPQDAEIVLEGTVPCGERRREGPFGDHYGHYSAAADFPVFRVKRQWQRRDAIYVAAVVGKPPQEDRTLGNAVQEMFLPLLRLVRPEVRDAWAWYETGFHALLTVSMRPRYEKESLKTAFSLLGEGQIALTKACLIVRDDVDCRDIRAVLAEVRRRFDPARDVVIIPNTAADTLDFAGPRMNHGSKLVLDVTGPEREAAPIDTLPDLAARHAGVSTQRLVADALLLVRVAPGCDGAALVQALVADPSLRGIPLIALVSEDVDLRDDVSWLWGLFTRFDPARDIVFRESRLRGAVPVHAGPMGIDATWKPGYPAPLEMPPEIVSRVDARWRELGLPRA